MIVALFLWKLSMLVDANNLHQQVKRDKIIILNKRELSSRLAGSNILSCQIMKNRSMKKSSKNLKSSQILYTKENLIKKESKDHNKYYWETLHFTFFKKKKNIWWTLDGQLQITWHVRNDARNMLETIYYSYLSFLAFTAEKATDISGKI